MMSRNLALDILKVILAFMVVGIHVGFLSDINGHLHYLTAEGIFRIAVPIFILISGFYFYSSVLENKQITYIKRIAYLYLSWMVIYAFFWFHPSEVSLIELVKILFTISIGYYHLWFLPGMIGAALLMLFLRKRPTKLLIIMISLTYITGVLIQYFANYQVFNDNKVNAFISYEWTHRNFLFLAFPFFAIGFLIHKYNLHMKLSLKSVLLITTLGVCLLLIESYVQYTNPFLSKSSDNYFALIFIAPGLFIVAMQSNLKTSGKELTLYSSGIYFTHIIFLKIYTAMFDITPSLLTILVFISSALLTFLIIKINNRYACFL